MIARLAGYFDKDEHFYFINVTTGGYGITIDEIKIDYLYLCGLLNSKLLDFYLKEVSTNFRGGYLAANKQYIEQLPIRVINFDDPEDVDHHGKIVSLVRRMLDLHKKLATAMTPDDKTLYQRQIDATDRQIDNLVYELYDLTDAEINIVEETIKG